MVVEVPVQVVRDGQSVRGLTADDFELYDGRRRQELIGFEVIDLARQGSEAAGVEPAPIRSSGRRHFLLLFDLSLSDPESIVRARRSVRDLLYRSLHPADLVAVATYSEYEEARLVLNFTPDREQVETAIDTLGLAQPAHAVLDPGVVPAGEYMLALTVSDPAGEVRSTSRIAVVVRDSPTDP